MADGEDLALAHLSIVCASRRRGSAISSRCSVGDQPATPVAVGSAVGCAVVLGGVAGVEPLAVGDEVEVGGDSGIIRRLVAAYASARQER